MKNFSKDRIIRSIVLSIVALVLISCASVAEESGPGVLEGVYTVEQAEAGRDAFGEICRTCHIPRDFSSILTQGDDLAALVGDYFGLITMTMPQDSPGSLSEQQYLDIMSYIISLNGIAPGDK